MNNLIEIGDKVDVFWCNDEQLLNVTVLHVPADTGDMWYFEDQSGNIRAQNPSAACLDCIIKRGERCK